MIDVDRARALTPGTADRIHLNNAGAALMTETVVGTQMDHLRLEAAIGGYEAAAVVEERIAGVHDSIARLIGATSDEIAIVENATVAWNLAFGSIRFEAGDTILTTEAEYASNFIMYLKARREHGVELVVVPSAETGQIDVAALAAAVDERTRLISISHVPTNGGLVNPAEAVGAVARDAGVPFLLDACQSVGQLEIDVEALGCDFLSATGRKFLRGPRGSGFLYVRRGILDDLEPPMVDLHGATWTTADRYQLLPNARRFENWEFNYASVLGLGAAVEEALQWGVAAIEERVVELGASLRTKLSEAGFETFDVGSRLCAIVTTMVPNRDPAEVRDLLFEAGINVSVTGVDTTRIDAERRGLPDLIRLSPHYYNTEEELDAAVHQLVLLRS